MIPSYPFVMVYVHYHSYLGFSTLGTDAVSLQDRIEIQRVFEHPVIGDLIPVLSLQSAVLGEELSWPTDRRLTAM